MTYQALFEEGAEKLKHAGIEECTADVWMLMQEVLHISSAMWLLHRSENIEDALLIEKFRSLIDERAKRYPVQYLIGTTEFMGMSFQVNPSVLIPRQDTEVLVESVLEEKSKQHLEILDMCTGSGCIGISLALLLGAEVTAVDVSAEALETAKGNCQNLSCSQVTFIQSDLFAELEPHQYDIIVSNPPYIPTREIAGLMPEVSVFEPKMALDGQADGLYFYRKMAEEAGQFLKHGGRIYWEIGCEQAEAVTSLLTVNGYEQIQVIKDYAGLNRVVKAIWNR